MNKDTVVAVYCSICKEKIATARLGDLRLPMTGSMFLSQDEYHGYPPPFDPSAEWEWMRCPHCRFRPFIGQDRIEIAGPNGSRRLHYIPTDAQDEVVASMLPALEDKEEMEAEIPEEPEEAWEDKLLTCEICGKKYNRVQMALHKKNHRRSDRRREKRALEG